MVYNLAFILFLWLSTDFGKNLRDLLPSKYGQSSSALRPESSPSQKGPSALAAKLPLKAIPIVDPKMGDVASAPDIAAPDVAPPDVSAPGGQEYAEDSAFVPSEKSIAFDPSISEFVPQAASK